MMQVFFVKSRQKLFQAIFMRYLYSHKDIKTNAKEKSSKHKKKTPAGTGGLCS